MCTVLYTTLYVQYVPLEFLVGFLSAPFYASGCYLFIFFMWFFTRNFSILLTTYPPSNPFFPHLFPPPTPSPFQSFPFSTFTPSTSFLRLFPPTPFLFLSQPMPPPSPCLPIPFLPHHFLPLTPFPPPICFLSLSLYLP